MTSRQTFEASIHSLQRRIFEKIELNTNYANTFNQIRYLTNQLNFYDRPNKPGYLSFQDFLHYFLQRMNFISLNTELEYLFYHYDSDMTGYIDYKDFIHQLYQQTEYYLPVLTADAITIFERIRSSFLSIKKKEQHNFLKFIKTYYFLLPYRTIKSRGKTFHRATLDELLEYFYSTDAINDSESITWDMFYEYYQCISLSIDSDELFELVIRHSWSVPNGVLDGKPMANEHEDVFERPRPSSHDSSDRNNSGSQHTRLLSLPMIPINPTMDHKSVSLRPMSLSMRVKPKVVSSNDVASRSPDSIHSLSSHLSSSSLVTRPTSTTSVLRPIVVVHSDYSEETVRIHDELGNTKLNPESLRNALQAMGIIDIKYVKV